MSSVENSSNDPQLQIGDSAERISESNNAGSMVDSSPNSNNESPISDHLEKPKEEKTLFDGSSHSFLIYFGRDRNKSGLILGIAVLVLQTVLYNVIFSKIFDDFDILEVEVPFGKLCDVTKLDEHGDEILHNLVCPPRINEWQHGGIASVLLSFFLMHDMFASIKAMIVVPGISSKIAAFFILLEAVIAMAVASEFALNAGSSYEAVANCIGILFIHDADEKAFEAFKAVELNGRLKNKCCRCCCWCGKTSLCSLLWITGLIFVFVCAVGNILFWENVWSIQEAYGSVYWEKNFADEVYSYYDSSTLEYSYYEDYLDDPFLNPCHKDAPTLDENGNPFNIYGSPECS